MLLTPARRVAQLLFFTNTICVLDCALCCTEQLDLRLCLLRLQYIDRPAGLLQILQSEHYWAQSIIYKFNPWCYQCTLFCRCRIRRTFYRMAPRLAGQEVHNHYCWCHQLGWRRMFSVLMGWEQKLQHS